MALRSCVTLGRSLIQRRCVTSIIPKSMYTTQLHPFLVKKINANIYQDIKNYENMRCQLFEEYAVNNNNESYRIIYRKIEDALISTIDGMKILAGTNKFNVEYDFESLKTKLKSEWLWLKNMHEAAQNIKGGTEFIKNYNSTMRDMYNHEIGKQILDHPLVDANGHSAASFFWTFCNIQYIYKNGWNKWNEWIQGII